MILQGQIGGSKQKIEEKKWSEKIDSLLSLMQFYKKSFLKNGREKKKEKKVFKFY